MRDECRLPAFRLVALEMIWILSERVDLLTKPSHSLQKIFLGVEVDP